MNVTDLSERCDVGKRKLFFQLFLDFLNVFSIKIALEKDSLQAQHVCKYVCKYVQESM